MKIEPQEMNLKKPSPETGENNYIYKRYKRTQGRKGHKLPRINMAFDEDLYVWIKLRSENLGITMTDLVNSIVAKEKNRIEEKTNSDI